MARDQYRIGGFLCRFAACGAIVTIAAPALAGSFGGFTQPHSYPVGDGAGEVVIGDLDGDGDLDLAAVNHWADTMRFIRNNGDGTFTPGTTYPTVNGPQDIAAGDLDGDGDLDLAAVGEYSDNKVAVYRNNGNAHFSGPVFYDTGDSPRNVVMGDFNGDTKVDVAVANRMDSNVSLLVGNGDGTLQPQVLFHLGGAMHDVLAVDVDDDGDLDLAAALWGANRVGILLNNGAGAFDPPINIPTGQMPFDLAFADFDHDGALDLATANFWDGTYSIMIGNGDGTFQPAMNTQIDPSNLENIVAGDFDRDGHQDIVITNGLWYTASVILGNGDGTFQPRIVYDSGSFPRGMETADLDGDGDLDLAIANLASDRVSMLFNLTPPPATGTELAEFEIVFGGHVAGDVESLRDSDDIHLRLRSQFGFSAAEANIIELIAAFETNVSSPAELEIVHEGRLNNPGGSATLRLRDWKEDRFEPIGTFAIGQEEVAQTWSGVSAAGSVRAGDGRIEVSSRISVVATFSAEGFDAFIDCVKVTVE